MSKEEVLMIPGPTPVPPAVEAAMGKPMISHRSAAFSELFLRIQKKLQAVLQTEQDVLVFPAAGTGGMEALLVNLFSAGDRLLLAETGEFGARFGNIARSFGLQVDCITASPGQGVAPDAVIRCLDAAGSRNFQGVLITHNETSTGVCNPLQDLGEACRSRNVLLLVDGVSSVGALPLSMDAWGLDGVVTASQKALMTPPGLAFTALSQRAWERTLHAGLPRAYWDLISARAAAQKGQTPYTPAVSLVYGLDAALDMILTEGLENCWHRHEVYGKAVRAGLKSLGLEPVARSPYTSGTVTAVWIPEPLEADKVRRTMQERYNVTVAGGQGELAGKIIRIGHMGYTQPADILTTLAALAGSLPGLNGQTEEHGQAVQSARQIMQAEGVMEA